MEETKSTSGEKGYRIVQPEGKITWNIEELWDGGVVRGPFGSIEAAMQHEASIAKAEGFADILVLKEADQEVVSFKESFEKVSDGNWKCILGCILEIDGKNLSLQEGMTFTKGVPVLGANIAEWLDENYEKDV